MAVRRRSRPGPYRVRVTTDLTPAQEATLAALREADHVRPEVDPGLRDQLRRHIEAAAASDAGRLDRPLFVNKGELSRVLACEAHHQAVAATPFEWNVATARGAVAHKAIELSVGRTDGPPPLALVDGAMARLADDPDQSIADFLLGLHPDARAELRTSVADVVGKFLELWPPLQRAWRPQPEWSIRAELCGGMVQLRGKADLALGAPRGMTAGRVVVDLKTGGPHPGHRDDVRFYALVDTLRTGVPPFRVGTYYLDAGSFAPEDVTPAVLDTAVDRTTDGLRRLLALRLGLRSASVTPNPCCGWCPARDACDGSRVWAEQRAEAGWEPALP